MYRNDCSSLDQLLGCRFRWGRVVRVLRQQRTRDSLEACQPRGLQVGAHYVKGRLEYPGLCAQRFAGIGETGLLGWWLPEPNPGGLRYGLPGNCRQYSDWTEPDECWFWLYVRTHGADFRRRRQRRDCDSADCTGTGYTYH